MNERCSKYKGLIWLLVVCTAVYVVCLAWSWVCIAQSNEFGDTAGWINGLFSALAFAGVIYAIFMQREELEMQRKELSDQKEEFKTQNETLRRQRFENTFFNMMQMQQQIADSIAYTYVIKRRNPDWVPDKGLPRFLEERNDLRGREVFKEMFELAPVDGKDEEQTYTGVRGLLEHEGLEGYEASYKPSYFDHYFRHLYRILKYVRTSDLIKDEDRYEYAAMVRAQLSRYELVWLYYNGLSVYGQEKFKPLIEEYAMLKNLRDELLVEGIELGIDYTAEAFQHLI